MTGIVGRDLSRSDLFRHARGYLRSYFAAMDVEIQRSGGSLAGDVMGRDPWRPQLPFELHPAWADSFAAVSDGTEFYIDLDGPTINGIHVAQGITIRLTWKGDDAFSIDDIEVGEIRIHAFELELDLAEARAATMGLVAAGRLMASLVEPPQGVR